MTRDDDLVRSRLYAIADAEVLATKEMTPEAMGAELAAAGVRVVQYRDKMGSPREVLAAAEALRRVLEPAGCLLIMNDRADLAVLAGFGGVHVGQGDLSPEHARGVAGTVDDGSAAALWRTTPFVVGVSTHTAEQVTAAEAGVADYVAVGPVFATGTKADASPVVGLDGVRAARALTSRPLVAIGGITLANGRSVIEAGADMVAVISGLFVQGRRVADVARDFLEILR